MVMHGIQSYTNPGDPNDGRPREPVRSLYVFSPVSEVQDTEKIAKLPEQLKVASYSMVIPFSEGLIVLNNH